MGEVGGRLRLTPPVRVGLRKNGFEAAIEPRGKRFGLRSGLQGEEDLLGSNELFEPTDFCPERGRLLFPPVREVFPARAVPLKQGESLPKRGRFVEAAWQGELLWRPRGSPRRSLRSAVRGVLLSTGFSGLVYTHRTSLSD